jgi:hypothetical protein
MTSEAVHVTGHCYCGAIAFSVDIPAGSAPIFTAYCHCDSCRRAHAAPLYHVACVDESMFRITRGADELNEFHKPGGSIVRAFCRVCGSKILNRFPDWKLPDAVPLAFFPDLLDAAHRQPLPPALGARKHNRPDECVLDQAMLQSLFER